MADRPPLTRGDIIQAVPAHHWPGALLVVDEVRNWGVIAFLRIPASGGSFGDAFIRMGHEDFEPVGARAPFDQNGVRRDV